MWMNGELIDEQAASISVLDHGVLYGIGAFETIRIYEGHPFLLDDHLDRLHSGLERMCIRAPYTHEQWREQIQKLIAITAQKEGTLRLTVTAGKEGLGLATRVYENPQTMIFIRPLPHGHHTWFTQGKQLQVCTVPRQAVGGAESFKTANYMNSVLARQEIHDFPRTEGLMLTPEGKLAEGIVSNLFFAKGNTIFTPARSLGILDGITRRFLIQLAKQEELKLIEGAFTEIDLDEADEIWVTNSVQEIVPIITWRGVTKTERTVMNQLYKRYQLYTQQQLLTMEQLS
ncbi:aminotransferase class IV [Polycladospora coralii]|nr:aminotransferase class IV [Polycladospora coralii]